MLLSGRGHLKLVFIGGPKGRSDMPHRCDAMIPVQGTRRGCKPYRRAIYFCHLAARSVHRHGQQKSKASGKRCNDISACKSCTGYHEQADNTGGRHDEAEKHGPTSPGGQGIQPYGAKSGRANKGAHSNLATLLLQLQLLA